MIKVQFKNSYENAFVGKEYTYQDYNNAEIGDIVVANTQHGYEIARVSQINVIDNNIDLDRIKTIEKVIISKKKLKKKKNENMKKR